MTQNLVFDCLQGLTSQVVLHGVPLWFGTINTVCMHRSVTIMGNHREVEALFNPILRYGCAAPLSGTSLRRAVAHLGIAQTESLKGLFRWQKSEKSMLKKKRKKSGGGGGGGVCRRWSTAMLQFSVQNLAILQSEGPPSVGIKPEHEPRWPSQPDIWGHLDCD